METSNKPEVRVIKGSIAKVATRRINDGEVGFLYFYVDDRSDIQSTLVIGDDAIPRSKVVALVQELVMDARANYTAESAEKNMLITAAKYGITNL